MLSDQRFLTALLDMQQNAQANLPVEPNNGNPRGANNMPTPSTPLPAEQGGARFYPWLAPSPSMEIIRSMLQKPKPIVGIPPVSQPTPPAQTSGSLPVMPVMSTGTPAMQTINPAPSTPVLPTRILGQQF